MNTRPDEQDRIEVNPNILTHDLARDDDNIRVHLTAINFQRDRQFVLEQKLAKAANDVLFNGEFLIPGARAPEPLFKARMFAPAEG